MRVDCSYCTCRISMDYPEAKAAGQQCQSCKGFFCDDCNPVDTDGLCEDCASGEQPNSTHSNYSYDCQASEYLH